MRLLLQRVTFVAGSLHIAEFSNDGGRRINLAQLNLVDANACADGILPRAKGEADRILAGAQGYRDQTVAEATGQAARFIKIYEEYKKAPDITRQRMFIEMQERVLSGADKIILDNKSGGSGVVPFLPLDQLQRPARKPEGAQ